jgi:hypothetical protein
MSIFDKDLTPTEALDAVAEAAYEEFQIRVPTEKISFYLQDHAKVDLAVKSSRRREILEYDEEKGKSRRFIRDKLKLAAYGGRIDKVYNNGIVGYDITINVYRQHKDLERRYWLLECLSHETGHAMDYELRRKIKPKIPEVKEYAAANSEFLSSSRELCDMLSKRELRKFYTSPYYSNYLPECAKRNIRIASEEIKKAEKAGKHNKTAKLERIIELSETMIECNSIREYAYEKLSRLGFENTKPAISEGWAFYFQNAIIANLIKKEIKNEIPEISGMDSLQAIKYASDNIKSLKLKNNSRCLIKEFNRYFINNRNAPGAYGEGFKKFVNLSKEEAKDLVFNYYYNRHIKRRDKRLKKNASKISVQNAHSQITP